MKVSSFLIGWLCKLISLRPSQEALDARCDADRGSMTPESSEGLKNRSAAS